jgi:succinate dehydrogenase / fumarate reductase cytochrome b subunit
MKQNRPIYMDLLRIRQPVPAVVSFLHRVSGALLFLGIPLLLMVLEASLAGPDSFAALASTPGLKFMLFILLAGFGYHLFAGVRFLLLDLHWGIALKQARYSAWAVLGIALVSTFLIGAWLW